MNEIKIEELKKIQIDILDYVSKFCDEKNINYWIDYGTLLGAVRHKGYIPWDDDIDIGMYREDYDRFMKEFNQNDSKYKLFCYEFDNNYLYPFGKVVDTDTVLYEPDEKGQKISVFIDIFVYDNAPDDDKKLNNMHIIRDINIKLNAARIIIPSDSILKNLIKHIICFILLVFPKGFFINNIIKNSKKYQNVNTKRVGNFLSSSKIAVNKNMFENFVYKEFEGKKYKAPTRYDEWLKAVYGDYMQLPPVEQRKTHHVFKAYYK